jgi:hypothetical protein
MLSAFQRLVQTNPAVDFLPAQAQNVASANVDLVLPSRDAYWFVRGIVITSVENLAWEVWFFSSATNMGGTMPTAKFLAAQYQAIPTANAQGAPLSGGGDGFYRYSLNNLLIPYFDGDFMANTAGSQAKLHIRLVQRAAAGKTANAGGAVQVGCYVSPQGAQV